MPRKPGCVPPATMASLSAACPGGRRPCERSRRTGCCRSHGRSRSSRRECPVGSGQTDGFLSGEPCRHQNAGGDGGQLTVRRGGGRMSECRVGTVSAQTPRHWDKRSESADRAPDDREHHDQDHADDGLAANAVHLGLGRRCVYSGNRFADILPTQRFFEFSIFGSFGAKSLILLVSALGLEPRTP